MEAEEALERERQRRKKLGMEIDSMSLWRLQHFPAAVQQGISMEAKSICYFQSVHYQENNYTVRIVVFTVTELQYLLF